MIGWPKGLRWHTLLQDMGDSIIWAGRCTCKIGRSHMVKQLKRS